MEFGEPEIVQIVESVWATVLNREAAPCGDGPDGAECLTGCVAITGAWTGNVLLHCDGAMARSAAAEMFGMPEDEVALDLVRDALGELTNIVGGNLKALFGGKCFLGLPTVADGSDYAVRVHGSRTVFRVPFVANGRGLVVEVAERVESAERVPARV